MALPARKRAIDLIVASTVSGGIGFGGDLPWRLKQDMAHFKATTLTTADSGKTNAVVMGRKTWESIPPKFRPLEGRINVVLSRSLEFKVESPDVLVAQSLNDAISTLSDKFSDTLGNIFVIGGSSVYEEALSHPWCRDVYLTRVYAEVECDTFFPQLCDEDFKLMKGDVTMREEGGKHFQFFTYRKTTWQDGADHPEMQYLRAIEDIINNGVTKGDRTGTGTVSKFGVQMRFDLSDRFPLLTTKRVFWRGVAEELLWFVKGETNAKLLADKGVNIWNGNASREYLDSIGLTDREEWDLGPVYGFQWRHFGAEYKTMHDDYTGQGVDQLQNVIDAIRNNPNDRRIVLSAWNPAALPKMALPPCHMFCQFYVANGRLSCQMYQRSADMGLGVPFNIASYSLLTIMIAHICGLLPGEFVHVIGDAHVYSNHIEPLKEQLARDPREFPTLKIKRSVKNIEDFTMDDFELDGYKPHAAIKMKMAV